MSSFNLSELFESVVDVAADRVAIASPARHLTYAQLDERANRLAHHLVDNGVGPGDHVGLHLLNGTEYLEGMLACFKVRAVPVNINHRYVERELVHLFTDADLVALVVHGAFAERVTRIAAQIATLRHIVVVDDGTPGATSALDAVDYELALAGASPTRDFDARSGDDLYIAYTGGTTGMPKGVLWRHEDLFFAALGGGDPVLDKGPIGEPDELPDRLPAFPIAHLCTPPLMHVSAHWGAFNTFFGGGKVVLLGPGRLDGDEVWQTVAAEGVNILTVVGDAMARPVLDALAANPSADTSTLFAFASGGAILSPAIKAQIAQLLPNALVIDAFGSSETGLAGSRSSGAGDTAGTARFAVDERTAVLDDEHRPVVPGSGVIGRLARRGHVPLGYYKDETKTGAAFVVVDGERWVLPGDMATVDDDGTVVLLGRGSGSINTGGEKVFPEEVEGVLKAHPAVYDVLVVGVPDERWGETVSAVVAVRPDHALTLDELVAFGRDELAGYKLPRRLVVVEQVPRATNGKPDYQRARELALESAA